MHQKIRKSSFVGKQLRYLSEKFPQNLSMVFFNLEALTQISGRSRFAFRRAKDAANNLGFHERWAFLRNQ